MPTSMIRTEGRRAGWIGRLDDHRFVVALEGVGDDLVLVPEVEDEGGLLPRGRAVEPRQSLHSVQALQGLVDEHGVEVAAGRSRSGTSRPRSAPGSPGLNGGSPLKRLAVWVRGSRSSSSR